MKIVDQDADDKYQSFKDEALGIDKTTALNKTMDDDWKSAISNSSVKDNFYQELKLKPEITNDTM